jgi:hypothetical protein
MTDAGTGAATPTDDPAVVRAQIAEKRQALGDTVEALVDKTDVKGRVAAKVDERKAQLHDQGERVATQAREVVETARQRPVPLAVVAAIVALLAVIFVVRRSRH